MKIISEDEGCRKAIHCSPSESASEYAKLAGCISRTVRPLDVEETLGSSSSFRLCDYDKAYFDRQHTGVSTISGPCVALEWQPEKIYTIDGKA